MESQLVRLNKYISNSGLCTRREADDYIQSGRVFVNNKLVEKLGLKISLNDEVKVDGDLIYPYKFHYLLLNKPLDLTLQDLFPEIEINFELYNGGPVEQDNLYYIHKIPGLIPNSIEISDGLYWGGNFQKVIELIKNNKLNPFDIRFFLGYSGWGNNQLNYELRSNTWILSKNIYNNQIIEKVNNSFWKEQMLELGGDYTIWSNAPENPSYN
jgi:putative transcriptional regulator